MLPLQGAWVQSLIGKLRSCMLHGKKKKKMKKRKLEKDAAAPSGSFLLVTVLEPRNCPEFKTSQAPASRLQGFLEFQPS